MRKLPFLTIFGCLLILLANQADAGQRLALVIGNGDYQFSRKLANPTNDAEKMGANLRSAGFKVTLLKDAVQEEIEQAMKDFSRELSPSDTALIFYAGHGVQVNGVSYLLPVDAEADAAETLKYEAVPLDMVLDLLDRGGKGASLKIVILDCCRDDPFGRGWRGSRSAASQTGLAAPTSTPKGTVLCFATDPGSVASDGASSNSPYTEGLLKHLFTPGLDIDMALRRAGTEVQSTTSGAQNPWRNSNFNGLFAVVPGANGAVSRPEMNDSGNSADKADEYYKQGRKYYYGDDGVEQDYIKALSWFQRAADLNHDSAQNFLGVMYYSGNGVKKDVERAIRWYKASAEQGNMHAQNNLGKKYLYGLGVDRDYKEAAKWIQMAADQGNTEAIGNLGYLYKEGYGVEQDYEKAVELMEKAIEDGEVSAMNNLGVLYEHGQGVKQDYSKAFSLFKQAADEGYSMAIDNLADLYAEGHGVTQNTAKAEELYLRSAEAGYDASQLQLGYLYFNGLQGFTKDRVLGYAWTLIADSYGNGTAPGNLKAFSGVMSASEMNDARTKAAELKKEISD